MKNFPLILIVISLVALLSGDRARVVPSPQYKDRGMRNNNPGNIKKGGSSWQGEIKPSTDSIFTQFESMPYGIRAAMKLLSNYYYNYDLKTIREIITRWSATDQQAYINYVSQCTGMSPDQLITLNRDSIIRQMDCQFSFENQYDKPSYIELTQGYNML